MITGIEKIISVNSADIKGTLEGLMLFLLLICIVIVWL